MTKAQALHAIPIEAVPPTEAVFLQHHVVSSPAKATTNIRHLKQSTALCIFASHHFDPTAVAVLRGQEEGRETRQFAQFLRLKRKYHLGERLQSDRYITKPYSPIFCDSVS